MADRRSASIWTYPWDLLDEGVEPALDRIQAAGLTGIALAAGYHAGVLLLPHNPRSTVRVLEDGVLYFRPRPGGFGGCALQPRLSVLTDRVDPLELACAAAGRRGLTVTAWTVCCHNSRLAEAHPELSCRNAFGDPVSHALCPGREEVRTYLARLAAELDRYPLASLQLESCGWMGFPHGAHHEKIRVGLSPLSRRLMGLCFCDGCMERARAEGIDIDGVRRRTVEYLRAAFDGRTDPAAPGGRGAASARIAGLAAFLELRDRIEGEAVARVKEASRHPLSVIVGPDGNPRVLSLADEAVACVYEEDPADVEAGVRAARAAVGPVPLAVGLDATPLRSPDMRNLKAKTAAARDAGADSLFFYNYGLMPLAWMAWLMEALATEWK